MAILTSFVRSTFQLREYGYGWFYMQIAYSFGSGNVQNSDVSSAFLDMDNMATDV
jgi:hypothetical protein